MRRLSILAIVLTLATGPDASILCDAWCTREGPVEECHETVATVVAAGCCDRPSSSLTAIVGGEVRMQTLAPDVGAGAIHHHGTAPATSARLLDRDLRHISPAHLLVTVLRI